MNTNDPILTELHRRLEYAALQSEVDEAAVRTLCAEVVELHLLAAVVNPVWVRVAAEAVVGSDARLVSVVGFPLGANRTDIKVAEAIEAIQDGADEIDLVANIGWLVSGRFLEVEAEIRKVRRQLPSDATLKVIVEAGKLTEVQLADAVMAVVNGGGQFVKTGTGFFGGATVEQVTKMVEAAGGKIEVKASGGIKTVEDCRKLLVAGATRLGTSSAPAIIRQVKQLSS